jgi:hypothetical protein
VLCFKTSCLLNVARPKVVHCLTWKRISWRIIQEPRGRLGERNQYLEVMCTFNIMSLINNLKRCKASDWFSSTCCAAATLNHLQARTTSKHLRASPKLHQKHTNLPTTRWRFKPCSRINLEHVIVRAAGGSSASSLHLFPKKSMLNEDEGIVNGQEHMYLTWLHTFVFLHSRCCVVTTIQNRVSHNTPANTNTHAPPHNDNALKSPLRRCSKNNSNTQIHVGYVLCI